MSVEIFYRMHGATEWYADDHELIRLPAGEWHVKGDPFGHAEYAAVVRGSSADDLIALAILSDAVHRGGKGIHLVIPYFPGARQDRWREGESLSIRVYADLINAMEFESVTILDPHSIVTPAVLNNCIVHDGARQAADALTGQGISGIIIPDAGAVKRSTAVADLLGIPTYQAGKYRSADSGKLDGFWINLPTIGGEQEIRLAVVDDIIDGGGTFMGLAEAAFKQTSRWNVHLTLYGTHGVFSGAASNLATYYDTIHTTDSIRTGIQPGFDTNKFIIHPVVQTLLP